MSSKDTATTTVLNAVTWAYGNAADTTTVQTVFQQDYISAYDTLVMVTDATPANKTFTDGLTSVGSDEIKITSHGYSLGLLVQLTTSGAVPAGLSVDTNYFVVPTSVDLFKLATSLANALAGTIINITAAAGGGTHTVKATALSGLGINWTRSLDGTNYRSIASSTITGAGTTMTSVGPVGYNYLKLENTIASGQVTVTAKIRSVDL